MRWFRRRSTEESEQEPRHLRTGRWGEAQAARYLRRHGFKILGRRVRVKPRGELDLIAREKNCLVFIEVKTRKNELFGRPYSSVDRAKRRALMKAAVRYMMKLRERPSLFRFDVVEILGGVDEGVADIRHIRKAFTLDPRYRMPW